MRIAIVAYGTWGDVHPSIALGQALQAAGYRIQLIVTKDFEQRVRDSGLKTRLLPIDKQEVMRAVSSHTHPLRVLIALHEHVAPALLQAGEGLDSITAEADVLLVNQWLLGIAAGIARVHELELVQMAMQPQIRTRRMPITTMPALPKWVPFQETYNLLSYDIARVLRWITYLRAGNVVRETVLGLPPLSLRDYLTLVHGTPSITLVSRHVVARPEDWPEHHHLTGYLFYDDPDWQPAAELKEFIASGRPPVYVGFGSMHDQRPDMTTSIVLEALRLSGRRAVLYRGWAGLGDAHLPGHVFPLDYAPHSWLFPRMAAVVHHAGAGTSAAALRAGTPSVPIPHSGDQPFWARRLHQLGVGTQPLPRSRLNVEDLSKRISTAVSDKNLRRRAEDFSELLRAEQAEQQTAAALEKILKRGKASPQ